MIKSKSFSLMFLASLALLTASASPDKNLRFKAKLIGSPYINSESGLGGSIPTGINEGGKVAGYYPIFDDLGNVEGLASFAWSDRDSFEDLGLGPSVDEETGFRRSFVAMGINDQGDIAGTLRIVEPLGDGRNRVRETFAFVLRADGNLEIFAPQSPFPGRDGFYDAYGNAINNFGEVVGHERFFEANGRLSETPPIIWSADGATLVDLNPSEPVVRRSNAVGADINDQGTIAGRATYYVDGRPLGNEAFIWNYDIGLVRLGALAESASGGRSSTANALNENEEVVGSSLIYSPENTYNVSVPFYWSAATGMVELPLLDLEVVSENQFVFGNANDINESGVVVGFSRAIEVDPSGPNTPLESRATIWVEGEAMDLNDLVINLDLELIGATSINDRGQIAAVALGETGQVGVLLTPVYQSGQKKGHKDGHPGLK